MWHVFDHNRLTFSLYCTAPNLHRTRRRPTLGFYQHYKRVVWKQTHCALHSLLVLWLLQNITMPICPNEHPIDLRWIKRMNWICKCTAEPRHTSIHRATNKSFVRWIARHIRSCHILHFFFRAPRHLFRAQNCTTIKTGGNCCLAVTRFLCWCRTANMP